MAKEIIMQQPIDRASLDDVIVGLANLISKKGFVFRRRNAQDISDTFHLHLVFPECLYGETQKCIRFLYGDTKRPIISLGQYDSFMLSTRLAQSSGFPAGRLKIGYRFKPETDKGVLDFIITDNDEYVPPERMESVKIAVETYFSGLSNNQD